jgi:predicted permease
MRGELRVGKTLRERFYRLLIFLYPAELRKECGEDMVHLFNDLYEEERRQRGWLGAYLFSLRSFGEIPFRSWMAHREERRHFRASDVSRVPSSQHISSLVQDFRFGLRVLKKSPAVVLITVLSLGLGIGAVTTVFSIANGLLFHPPVGLSEPDRLFTVYTSRSEGGLYGTNSFPDYLDLVVEIDAFQGAAAFGVRGFTLAGGSEPESLLAEEVTGNYFTVTGMRPVLGRGFLPGETEIGAVENVVVISHDLWLRRFGGESGVLGQSLRLNDGSFTIVGVAPEGVVSRRVPVRPDLWVPIGIPGSRSERRTEGLAQREIRPFLILGRIREGGTLDQLQAQLSVLSQRLFEEHPASWAEEGGQPLVLTAVEEKDSRINPRARPLLAGIAVFFLGAAGLILLIACSNVATLFLARAGRRRREMAIRVSVGASRRRIVGLLLVEGLLPGLLGGAVGVAMAYLAVGRMASIPIPINVPVNLDIAIDYRVLAFALMLSVGATLVFGLIPALSASNPDLVSSLKGEARGMGRVVRRFSLKRIGLRNLMVVVQCAASLVLVVGAALFIRTLQGATTMDLGFDPQGVAVMTKSLSESEYPAETGLQYFTELRERLAALPGVASAQISRGLDLTLFQPGREVEVSVPGVDPTAGDSPRYLRNSVTPGFLEMLGVPMLRGRTLEETDGPDAPMVAVVNETFARRFWPGEDPVGRQFRLPAPDGDPAADDRLVTVVGLARDGKYEDFDDGPIPYIWTSFYQDFTPSVAISLEGSVSAEAMVPLLREHVLLDPGEAPLISPATLESQVSIQFIHLRIASMILGWSGIFGLILAAIGIYGIVSVAVAERTREMAIRMAMGAERLQVVRQVAQGGMSLAGVGLLAGLVVVLPLAHLLRSVLYGVGAVDPLALTFGIGILVLSALVASVVPARRATRIDPMKTLREE